MILKVGPCAMSLKTKKIEVNSRQMAYFDCGDGPVIMFVHGFPLSKQMWRAQLDALQDSYRVLVPDMPGFGESECVDGDAVTMRQYADHLIQFLTKIEICEPISICGLSMGGYVVWELLDNYPDRIDQVVLCHTRAANDDETVARGRRIQAQSVLQNGTASLIEGMIPKLVASQASDSLRAEVQQIMMTASSCGVAQALGGMSTRKNFMNETNSLAFDTLVIAGKNDTITPPKEMQEMARYLKGARFQLIDDCGHLSPLEQPQVVNQLLREFLRKP